MSADNDLAEVIGLLERWRDAGGIGRMQIGVEASRTISAMSPERKRAFAIEVAERVAPQLVPAIEAEDGDLTAKQVGAVVDLLRRADREQLDDLVTALRTGQVDDALVIVDDALDAISDEPDAGADGGGDGGGDGAQGVPEPPQEVGPGQPARPTQRERSGATGAAAAGAAAAGAAAAASASGGAATDGDRDADEDADDQGLDDDVRAIVDGASDLVEEAAASVLGDDEEIEVGEDGRLELDEDAVRERMEQEAAERAKQYRESSPEIPRQPAYRAPSLDFTDRDLDLPDTSVEEVAPLRERIAGDRRGPLAAPPVTAPVAAITARADGYRRRRAALRAIEDEALDADEVAAVVRSLDRGTDKAWVAGAALDAGIVRLGDLEGLGLPSTALDRLRRRAG